MRNLKNIPQKRWYRIKDGVIYDILKIQPSINITNDYIYSHDIIDKLPRIKCLYGYVDANNKLTKYAATTYLYLDEFIELGDTYKDSMFIPYINNSEDRILNGSSYYKIYKKEVEDECGMFVENNFDREFILNKFPWYCKTVNETKPYKFTQINVSIENKDTAVNCIYKLELENCFDNETFSNGTIYDYEANYREFVINVIQNYICTKGKDMLKKQQPDDVYDVSVNIDLINEIQATYNITDTTNEVSLLGTSFDIKNIEKMYVNGSQISPTKTYKFNATGEHICTFHITNTTNNLNNLFYRCDFLTKVDCSKLNCSTVYKFNRMFSNCKNLIEINLSNCNLNNIKTNNDIDGMFDTLPSLKTIIMTGKPPLLNSNDLGGMFIEIGGITSTLYYGSKYDYTTIINEIKSSNSWKTVMIE